MHLFAGTDSEFCDAGWALKSALGQFYEVRFLRGHKMRTLPQLFYEFAAVLQFSYYFGENYPAFDEGITDLSWLPASGYTLLLTNSLSILADEQEFDFKTFMRILSAAADSEQPARAKRSLPISHCDARSHRRPQDLRLLAL